MSKKNKNGNGNVNQYKELRTTNFRPELWIDGVWPLEDFVSHKNAKAGIKFGFFGIGQGGNKITDAFAGIKDRNGNPVYKTIIVNSNLGDMEKINNVPKIYHFPLVGYENGVGKDPEVGEKAFQENGATIFNAIQERLMDCDFIFVNNSMGGGTGTGAVNVAVDAISDYLLIPTGSIISLPRPDEIESLNAYNATAELVPKLSDIRVTEEGEEYRGLEALIVLDNDKIIKEHREDPEVTGLSWDFYSNYKVAAILHEINVLTSLGSDYTLDAADLFNRIIKQGSVLTFAKKKINLDEVKTKEDLTKEIQSTYRGRNVLANGFDYENDMRSMAMIVVMPQNQQHRVNQDTLEEIRTNMMHELPNVNFYPGSVSYETEKKEAIVYTMASMGGLPERAKQLREEAEDLRVMREEREKKTSGFNMGEKLERKSTSTAARRSGAGINPFAAAATDKKPSQPGAQKSKISNPFNSDAFKRK
ncbi:cell division GTPase FtsZ [Paenibacillus polymyxa]